MQLHVLFRVGDLDEAERTVLALGGTTFDPQHQPERSRVFADPAGHAFCIVPIKQSSRQPRTNQRASG